MTLDEAIKHCYEVADRKCDDCGKEHLQLAKWLEELQAFKNKADYVKVKHSRWENISGFDVCNICGTSPAYCEPKPNNPKGYPPYCHNCGADMRRSANNTRTPKERGGEK